MKKLALVTTLTLLFLMPKGNALAETTNVSNNNIQIIQSSRHLHSRLSKSYTGFVYKIKNKSTKPIYIEKIQLQNNANSQVATLSLHRTTGESYKNTIKTGAKYALPSLTLSLWGSIIVSPFVAIGNETGNLNLQKEAEKYDKQPKFPRTIQPQETIIIKTMSLTPHKPFLRVFYKNPLTEETMQMEL